MAYILAVKCASCGKPLVRESWRKKYANRFYCNAQCRNEGITLSMIEDFAKRVGTDDLKTYMVDAYIHKRMSIRQIMKEVGTNSNRSVMKLLDRFDIEIRRGSDAVKTQWENNDKRRKVQVEKMREQSIGKPAYNSGQTKDKGGKQALILSAARMGKNNPMYGRRGEESPFWNPDRTHENRLKERKFPEYKDWMIAVYTRDNFTCQCCDSIGKRLNAHHLESYHSNEELRTVVSNGVTLCEPCHKDFHKEFGNKNNTTEQFCEYMKSKGKTFRR